MNSPDTPAPATTTRNFRSAITPRKTGQSPPRWPKFKPPAAVTTTGAGDPCLTLREPPSLPPGGAPTPYPSREAGDPMQSNGHNKHPSYLYLGLAGETGPG